MIRCFVVHCTMTDCDKFRDIQPWKLFVQATSVLDWILTSAKQKTAEIVTQTRTEHQELYATISLLIYSNFQFRKIENTY